MPRNHISDAIPLGSPQSTNNKVIPKQLGARFSRYFAAVAEGEKAMPRNYSLAQLQPLCSRQHCEITRRTTNAEPRIIVDIRALRRVLLPPPPFFYLSPSTGTPSESLPRFSNLTRWFPDEIACEQDDCVQSVYPVSFKFSKSQY